MPFADICGIKYLCKTTVIKWYSVSQKLKYRHFAIQNTLKISQHYAGMSGHNSCGEVQDVAIRLWLYI